MNISLPAETIFHLFGFSITNSIFAGWLVVLLLIIGAFLVRRSLKKVPGRTQNVLELAYGYFWNNAVAIIGREDVARLVFPLVMTLFFYILFSNWLGLIPGVAYTGIKAVADGQNILVPLIRPATSDLNTTVALALISVGFIQYVGLRYAGVGPYIGKFFNFKNPLGFFIGLIELISEFSRIISFSVRLFANVFGGEVLLTVIFYLIYTLVPYLAFVPSVFMGIEMFIGFVQAFIFAFLVLVFTSLAISTHDSEGHAHGGEELHVADMAAEAENTILHTSK